MKKSLFLTVLLAGILMSSKAQDFLPYLNDNYAGINQVTLQPAAIANSRFAADINLFGVSSEFMNDMFKFKTFSLNALAWKYDDPHWWENNTILEGKDGDPENAFVNLQLLGPSFLISLDNKQAIGFTYSIRGMINVDNLGEPLGRLIYYNTGTNAGEYWGEWQSDRNIGIGQNVFAQYGLSYAREILDKGEHYLKGGATLKFLQGLGASYINMDEYDYRFEQSDPEEAKILSWKTPEAKFGVSENWGYNENDNWDPKYMFASNLGVGFDLGFVYEWRPDYEDYRYDMDGEVNLPRKDLNKYKLKVGVSVLDIGKIRYRNNSDLIVNNFSVGDPFRIDLDTITFNSPPYNDFADMIAGQYGNGITPLGTDEYFIAKLPTALSFQVDYNVTEGLYVNLTTFTAFNQGEGNDFRSHYLSNYSVTPRYENKWFGAAIPLMYNQYNQFTMGLGLRLGILYMGTKDLLGLTGITNHFGTDLYVGVKIPILYKGPPADLDGDNVSDKMDKCLTVPGTWALKGCPDKDGDGVPDNEDLCPDDPGLVQYSGCPDRDGDGIIDKLDNCPDEPGLEEFNGCPDTDGDGIIDSQDRCPETPGIAAFFGCPDTDGDGIPDHEDLCPTEAGTRENQGCPFADMDGDGIRDKDDKCPEVPGPAENDGCPYVDTDGDGVLDKDDKCPLTPGDPANDGCPVLQEAEIEIINTAFDNLEFETNKAVILAGSYPSLNELANLLKEKETWKIRIAGHTDSVGRDEYNMELSQKRAQAVANYLSEKGISRDRMIVEWYGETRPIADNSTAAGRASNRRVEMDIVFD